MNAYPRVTLSTQGLVIDSGFEIYIETFFEGLRNNTMLNKRDKQTL